MYGLVIVIVGLLTLPLLFPEETISWLRQALHWLEQRREKRERDSARLDSMDHELMEWESWVATLHRRLPHTHAPKERYRLLTQGLAAGERYLQGIDPQECPELYQRTERICQRLQHQLAQFAQRSKKKRGETSRLPPHPSA